MGTVACKRMTDADQIAGPHVQLALWMQQLQQDLARLLVAAPSDADDSSDVLTTCKEGAAEVNSTYQTIWRWANENPEALGVTRVGGKVFVSLRKLRFFAHRRRSKL
jgi:hypothetical protein